MGNFSGKPNISNWNNINTEEISSTIPYMTGMNQDSKNLKNMLADFLDSDSETSVNENFMKKYSVNNDHTSTDISPTSQNVHTSTELSATSPFITSDLYNNIMNKNNTKMVGGGNSSSTSSTSDMTQSVDKKNKYNISSANSEISGGEFSYQSSSAHTSGHESSENSEAPKVETDTATSVEADSEEVQKQSSAVTTEEEDEDKKKKNNSEASETLEENPDSESSSINTADINMVSVDTN